MLGACSDDVSGPAPVFEPPRLFETVGGVEEMSARLPRLAQAFAVALGQDPDLRERVRRAIEESMYPEGQVYFQDLFADAGSGWPARDRPRCAV